MENYLRKIIEGTASYSGQTFLEKICFELSSVIEADYVFVAKFNKEEYTSRTITLLVKGEVQPNFQYDLKGTPCANVYDGKIMNHPKNVYAVYPEDHLLLEMKIEGYLGAPLYNTKGEVMALIVALYESEIDNSDLVINLFQIFSGRISSELERMGYEEDLIELNQSLEVKVIERTEELERAQEQLIESEKLASLGSLVAGIAHEVNTPLGVAITAESHLADELSYVIDELSKDSLSKEKATEVIDGAIAASRLLNENLYRAKELIENFKQTAADQIHTEKDKINLENYYSQTVSTLKPLLKGKKATVDIQSPQDITIETYPGAHSQIITNLISNSITHGFSDSGNNKISIKISFNNDTVKVEYQDNGYGISEETTKRAFEPFYTSNRAAGNTGLGLSIVHNLVVKLLEGSVKILASNEGFKLEYEFRAN